MGAPHAAGRAEGRNGLAGSRSVYLLQHASNPVDWHPWGAEAIAAARRRDVPLLVSIGYSTCYWCHVMERESFEDTATAEILNRVCVPVKVDREERPDIDAIMMTACQLFTQMTEGRPSGGWPLNVFLEPRTLQPFFCGTYYPPQAAFGRVSLTHLLQAVEAAWANDRAGLAAQAERLGALVSAQLDRRGSAGAGAAPPTASETNAVADAAVTAIMRMYDAGNGGFGSAPKFPTPSYPMLLLAARGDDPGIARALRHTLDAMAIGGICDQVGGGFHRYSVDAQWTVPHFEKMLYDNAQLATLYALAAERWGDSFYAGIVRRTLDYVLREMTGTEGQFYSAQDAEVQAREGGNYVWTEEEVREALASAGAASAELTHFALRAFGLLGGPNFVDPHHPGAAPSSVLRLPARPDRMAAEMGLSPAELERMLALARSFLSAARAARPQPMADDKTIAAWCGLMIQALATAGRVLAEPSYTEAGVRAAEFVLSRMQDSAGGLLRVWRDGRAAIPAFLEDYACVCNGLLALHRATGADAWRARASALAEAAHARFADPATGAWFDVAEGQNELWVRAQELDDGAMPCGTSAMLHALIELGGEHRARAERLLGAAWPAIREQPATSGGTVLAALKLATLGAT